VVAMDCKNSAVFTQNTATLCKKIVIEEKWRHFFRRKLGRGDR
jgi:hypothetical protein